MTSFESHLLAGAIILVVDLLVTYMIIDGVIKARDKRVWGPARLTLIRTLQRNCGTLMGGWAIRSVGHGYSQADIFDDEKLAHDLREEVIRLSSVSPNQLVALRPEEYWLGQLERFCDLQPVMRLAIDRVQLTLHTDPQLVAAIAEFEKFFTSAPFVRDAYKQVGDRLNPTGVPAIFSVAESVRRTLLVLVKLHDQVQIAAGSA